ncbi:MAG: T9SS type A sorting domain-containing protein [Bacteroidota bacterium]
MATVFLFQELTDAQDRGALSIASPSASNFAYPQSLFVDSQNGHLWVTDFDNHRVLRFDVSQLTAVEELRSSILPGTMFLFQNYPNPFNPETRISFSVGTSGTASVIVYNLLGQKIKTLFHETVIAQTVYSLAMNGKDLSSGIYLYVLRSEEGIQVRRMCLLK